MQVERTKISNKQFTEVRQKFEKLDSSHPKMRVKIKTAVDEKEERYRSYVAIDLVRVESYGHTLFSEWIPRSESVGLEIHDPKVWLEERAKSKKNRINF